MKKQPKSPKSAAQDEAPEESDTPSQEEALEERFEKITEMMEFAEAILEALKCGETVETLKDADVAIAEARDAARSLLAIEVSCSSE